QARSPHGAPSHPHPQSLSSLAAARNIDMHGHLTDGGATMLLMKKNIQYIGVAGTAGSGKDTAAMLMGEMFGSIGLSTGDMVRAIARQVYHLPEHVRPTHDQSYNVATFMRKNISPSSIIELCLLEGKAQNVPIVIIH